MWLLVPQLKACPRTPNNPRAPLLVAGCSDLPDRFITRRFVSDAAARLVAKSFFKDRPSLAGRFLPVILLDDLFTLGAQLLGKLWLV